MENIHVFDCEADGLDPTKIYCLVTTEGKTIKSATDYAQMRYFLRRATVLVGHNIIRFDVPILEKLLNIKIKAKLIDTLALSWYLYPERNVHGLESWGEDFGVPKPPIEDWYNLPIEEYVNRCTEDVKINKLLWEKQWRYLLDLYGSEEEALKLIDYLSFKMDCAREQERSGWQLDRERVETSLNKMLKEHDDKFSKLKEAMPKVPIFTKKARPMKPFKKDGTYSGIGAKWFSLLRKKNLPENYAGIIEEQSGEKEPNPASSQQIKDWLYSVGWVPLTFKYIMDDATRKFRQIPQIRKDVDGEKVLCDSVVKLKDKLPAIEYLQGITVLSHRMSILKGFLENADENNRVKAEIGGFTNTLRVKHRIVVNLPGVDKPYGEDVRGSLIANFGEELCGSDMAALEDRTKQHYMMAYDPEYVKEMNKPGWDPHLDIAVIARMMTQEEVEAYKNGDHAKKPVRHKAKTANYACTYGVTPKGLVRNTGMHLKEAEILHAAYWKRNWSLIKIAEDTITKVVHNQKWLFNPVSKFWYSLRADKDRFSTLNQGTGSYCFDMWIKEIRSKRSQLTSTFHDEGVWSIKPGHREDMEHLLKWAIQEVNRKLNMKRDLDVSISFGNSYAEIH